MKRAMALVGALANDNRAAAGVEMALITPVFLVMMFGAVDLGNYFMDEHVVVKAVRDGARYASRRGFSDYPCGGSLGSGVTDPIKNITRTGQLASGGTPRLNIWTDPTTIDVSVHCDVSNAAYNNGIYRGAVGGIPIVKVTAQVPYRSLFRHFGITNATINLNASSEVPVMGI